MTRWISNLTPREKLMLVCMLPVVLLIGAYQLVWLPLDARRDRLVADIAAYQLVSVTALQRPAHGAIPVTAAPPAVPIATRVTQSADSAGLQLRRLAPEGEGLRVTLDDVDFGAAMLWVAEMEVAQGIRVAAIEVDRRPEPGVVSARLLLEDAL